MALGKLFNLFALSSLAVLVCNLQASPVTALAHDGHHLAKVRRAHGHDNLLKNKRKRDQTQRCKPRPSSSASSSSETPAPTTTYEATSSTPAPTTTSSSDQSSSGGDNGSGNTSSSSSSPSTPVTNSGRGKITLAWPNGNEDSLRNFVTNNVQYIYTWSEQCPSLATELGLKCLPMLWNNAGDKLSAWQSTVVSGYANIALGFNEVNEGGQANMGVDSAVSTWQQYLEPLVDQGYSLIAPCTSSNPNGFDWTIEFFSKCTNCHISGIALHYYGTDAQDMIEYIEKWYNQFKLPIWVTEFACQNFNTANENNGQQCSESQVWQFYSTIINYMESNDNVVSWAPFGFMRDMQGVNELDSLMNDDGTPTALGSAVINLSF